jgi:hypothetical protein
MRVLNILLPRAPSASAQFDPTNDSSQTSERFHSQVKRGYAQGYDSVEPICLVNGMKVTVLAGNLKSSSQLRFSNNH